jgi:hypothetical protein
LVDAVSNRNFLCGKKKQFCAICWRSEETDKGLNDLELSLSTIITGQIYHDEDNQSSDVQVDTHVWRILSSTVWMMLNEYISRLLLRFYFSPCTSSMYIHFGTYMQYVFPQIWQAAYNISVLLILHKKEMYFVKNCTFLHKIFT